MEKPWDRMQKNWKYKVWLRLEQIYFIQDIFRRNLKSIIISFIASIQVALITAKFSTPQGVTYVIH